MDPHGFVGDDTESEPPLYNIDEIELECHRFGRGTHTMTIAVSTTWGYVAE